MLFLLSSRIFLASSNLGAIRYNSLSFVTIYQSVSPSCFPNKNNCIGLSGLDFTNTISLDCNSTLLSIRVQ